MTPSQHTFTTTATRSRKPYDAYEVHGVAAFGDGPRRGCEPVPDDEAEFWSLYGHIPGEGVECVGDFATRRDAEDVRDRITGGAVVPALVAALDALLTATVDADLKFGFTVGEDQATARERALAAIAQVVAP